MEFAAEHRFPAPTSVVADVLVDPTFYEALDLPDLRLDGVVAAPEAGDPGEAWDPGEAGDPEAPGHPGVAGARLLVLRYEYTGALDPMARRLLGGGRLTWTQEVRIAAPAPADPRAGTVDGEVIEGWLAFRSEERPELLHGDARFDLTPDGAATVRRLAGQVVVALPVIGGMAERRIVPGFLARLDVEAEGVRRRCNPAGAR